MKILVAEDNLINQKILRALLTKKGYQIEIVEDGLKVLETYKPEEHELILMDCQMPNLDGLAATERLREMEKSNQWARCPIVALTANAMSGDRERCLNVGMDDFVAKPFRAQELMEKIESWLTQTRLRGIQ